MEVGIVAQEVVQGKLVEGECFDQHAASGVGQSDQVKVALHDAVFTRCAVNGDVGKVKFVAAIAGGKREVVAVNVAQFVAVMYLPVARFDFNYIAVVFLSVHKGEYALCRAQGHIMFGGVASGNNGYCPFHI